MNKYIAKHSLVTNLGAIVFFISWILIMVSFCLEALDQTNIRISLIIYMALGGSLIGLGLICELQ